MNPRMPNPLLHRDCLLVSKGSLFFLGHTVLSKNATVNSKHKRDDKVLLSML